MPHRKAVLSDWHVRRLLSDSPIGLCLVDLEGVITHIEGGALHEVGTTPSDWVGQKLTEPWITQGYLPALRGEVAAFSGMDPVNGTRGQLIVYTPRYDGRGNIAGVAVWWAVLGEGQQVTVGPEETPNE